MEENRVEVMEEVEVTEMEPEMESNSGVFGTILKIAAIGAGAAAVLHLTKDKRNAKKEKKAMKLLEKKGYTVTKAEAENENAEEPVEETTEEK